LTSAGEQILALALPEFANGDKVRRTGEIPFGKGARRHVRLVRGQCQVEL
jgi:hypothetical protein